MKLIRKEREKPIFPSRGEEKTRTGQQAKVNKRNDV